MEAKYYKPSDGGYFIDVSKVDWNYYDYDELETNAPSLPYTTDLRTLLDRTVLASETYYITSASIVEGNDNCTLGEFSVESKTDTYNANVTVNATGSSTIKVGYHYKESDLDVTIRIDVTKNEVAVNDVTLHPTTATLTAGGDPVVLTATVKPDGRATDNTAFCANAP